MFSERPELGLAREGNKKRSQTRTVLGEEGVKKSNPKLAQEAERGPEGPTPTKGAVMDTQ